MFRDYFLNSVGETPYFAENFLLRYEAPLKPLSAAMSATVLSVVIRSALA